MRSSVSYMLSEGGREPAMSHPDYEQISHDHGALLILTRGLGDKKPKSLQKVFERIQKVNNLKVTDPSSQQREIWFRYIQEHPPENNDWGDFQTHRRALGLITVGKFDTQLELNELCRVHESLKVKYTNTLYDSRCILFGPENVQSGPISLVSSSGSENNSMTTTTTTSTIAHGTTNLSDENGVQECNSNNLDRNCEMELKDQFTTPSNFKSHVLFYKENDPCLDLEKTIEEFLNALFWILESKRLEKTREKIDKIALLTAPFEIKDFVGLDMESRNNKKRCMGRATKHLGDLTLQTGLVAESLNLFCAASETLRAIGDSLWLGAAYEGLCSASAIILYPHLRNRRRKETSNVTILKKSKSTSDDNIKRLARSTFDPETPGSEPNSTTSSVSSTSSVGSTSSGGTESSTSSSEHHTMNANNRTGTQQYPPSILTPEEIISRYRDAIINYSKYRHAGIIETEAALKAARICIEQNQKLDVSMFCQNVLYINLQMSELEKVKRFEVLKELYLEIDYQRKAAFCQRLAAWRHVAQTNPNPNWNQSYKLMLDSFAGHKLSLEPREVLLSNTGWPVLQVDLLQQLVGAARRLGHSALATRHMTFLLQTMWKHLNPQDQREMALQLQNLSSQCEGSPVALNLESGTTIPPANLTDLPYCLTLEIKEMPPSLRPDQLELVKANCGPFIFTPLHFGSMDRRGGSNRSKTKDRKITFNWVQHDLCEVSLKLTNPLPFELHVSDMRLLTDGIVFESLPQTIILQPNHITNVILQGTPLEIGDLLIRGYSTHTLGVKSNCELKDMFGRQFPIEYLVSVIPALPKLEISTSATQSPMAFISTSNTDTIALGSITIYNGETEEIIVTLTNTSNVLIEHIECEITSSIDSNVLGKILSFSKEEIQSKLPLKPGDSLEFVLKVFGEADFIGSIQPNGPSVHDGPPSLSFNTSNTLSVHQGIPSRVNSPTGTPRRTELTSSFRSTHSGQSSLNTLSLGIMAGHIPRQVETQIRFRYSGADGLKAGYCRHCSINFNLELLPSAQVTSWDVLPAETGSQFYLVLDVTNLTAQEMTLNYTENKTILIEAKETCRIPVPVERCDLDRMLIEYHSTINDNQDINSYIIPPDVDLPEKLCAEHISKAVNLQWALAAGETTGIATLKGISLSTTMLDLVTVAPLQWDVVINDQPLAPQSEVTCIAGQSVSLGIRIQNVSSTALQQLTLSIQFYQDYLNGILNYRLETRVIMSGPNCIEIPLLDKSEKTRHDCTVLFFTPGRFKADIQCKSLVYSNAIMTSNTSRPIVSSNASTFISNNPANQSMHVWRFIPPVEITVVEQ